MKKILFLAIAIVAIAMTSCEKEAIGGTAVENMAGQWYVVVEGVADDGSILSDDDLFGLGRWILLTYNTASDDATKLYIDDQSNFWNVKFVADCNTDKLSFTADATNETWTEGEEEDEDGNPIMVPYDINVVVNYGRIVPNGTTTPSGAKADLIEFNIEFEDDPYAGVYYNHLRISGWRYTGLAADD